jgi:phosphoribosyl 1,2-cyclic phosphate phosphodiesterase
MNFKFTILGCGSSFGVPRADGNWGKCDPTEFKNNRTRCSALISFMNKNILIDTSPDLRIQLIKNKVTNIDAVLYSHLHADQTHGINDLRVFYMNNKKKINIYADIFTRNYLQSNFSYCFKNKYGYPPILDLKKIKKNLIFKIKNKTLNIKSIPVKHGPIESLSFIINKKCGYASDVNEIYKKDLNNFKNLEFFIIDCLRLKKHPSHFNLDEVLNLVKILIPKKTILTNLHSDLDYNYLLKNLPNNIRPAYDGLSLNIK